MFVILGIVLRCFEKEVIMESRPRVYDPVFCFLSVHIIFTLLSNLMKLIKRNVVVVVVVEG